MKTFSLWDPDRFISLLSFGSSVNSTHVFNDKSDLTQEESMVSNLITSTHDNNNDTIELSHSMPVFVPTPIHGAKSDQALDKSTVDALEHKSVEKDLSKIMEQQEPLELNDNQELNEVYYSNKAIIINEFTLILYRLLMRNQCKVHLL